VSSNGAAVDTFAVILATRNRPEQVERSVSAILASPVHLDLIVIDQSDDGLTGAALARFADDRRVTLLKSAQIGLSRARNIGWQKTNAELLAFTDDDCEACPGWLEGLATAFRQDQRIGVVFGAVRAPDYDRSSGFVMAYVPQRFHVVRRIGEKASVEGVGACMAVRRSTLTAVGGFDEELGVGARLCSAEDTDIAVRALLAGFYVCETPDAAVWHHGFRNWSVAQLVVHGYMVGLGAANAKMLRLGKGQAIRPIAALAWRWLAKDPVVDLNHRPPRMRRLRSFLVGFRAGVSTALDAKGRFTLLREDGHGDRSAR
jgi:glycosyltransferase involved in cell wall biosynthesis